jgi:hypothetical protein
MPTRGEVGFKHCGNHHHHHPSELLLLRRACPARGRLSLLQSWLSRLVLLMLTPSGIAWVDVSGGVVMPRSRWRPVLLRSPWSSSSLSSLPSSFRLSSSQRTEEEEEEKPLVSRLCPPRLLLSFDLDDTLWYTDQVVRSANEAMIQAMIQEQQRPPQQPASSSVRNAPKNQRSDNTSASPPPPEEDRTLTVEDFLATTRTVRKSLKDPVTYQNLRKLSIRTTFQQLQEATTATRMATTTVVGGGVQEGKKKW